MHDFEHFSHIFWVLIFPTRPQNSLRRFASENHSEQPFPSFGKPSPYLCLRLRVSHSFFWEQEYLHLGTFHPWFVHLNSKPGQLCLFRSVWLFSKNIGFYAILDWRWVFNLLCWDYRMMMRVYLPCWDYRRRRSVHPPMSGLQDEDDCSLTPSRSIWMWVHKSVL